MDCILSKSTITSFCGNVVPLKLLSQESLAQEDIKWYTDSNVVSIRDFAHEKEFAFNDGVLLTLKEEGTALVWAEYKGQKYTCEVTSQKRRTASKDDDFNYYIGDFHDHTTQEHNHEAFAVRETGLPIDYINQIKEENLLDFSVISDHAIVTNPKDFFREFTDEESAQPMEIIIFPGTESEVNLIENDRFGLNHKNSGEIVCVNADGFSWSKTWEPFYEAFANSPFAVGVVAHPQIVGWDKNGIWNFCFHKNNTPFLKGLIKGVELGCGYATSMLHEHCYSLALDYGFKVSVTCSSDSHGPKWGYHVIPAKTIIMAPEKSKEMFLDALWNKRFYASESGNVKLWYTVNGHMAGDTLPLTNRYSFQVQTSLFHEDDSARPVKCQVISDYGLVVKEIEGEDLSSFQFEITSDTARYFYLRFIDSQERKTWSPPVWTGREYDNTSETSLVPLDKSEFTATELTTGKSAEEIINNDPTKEWQAECPTPEIVIDMKKEYPICAVGHYPFRVLIDQLLQPGYLESGRYAQFVSEYAVSVSVDGINYKECAHGRIRVYGGEHIITFPEVNARYVKFNVIDTTGRFGGYERYYNSLPCIAELSVFQSEK